MGLDLIVHEDLPIVHVWDMFHSLQFFMKPTKTYFSRVSFIDVFSEGLL